MRQKPIGTLKIRSSARDIKITAMYQFSFGLFAENILARISLTCIILCINMKLNATGTDRKGKVLGMSAEVARICH
jgi:hypothetical protein